MKHKHTKIPFAAMALFAMMVVALVSFSITRAASSTIGATGVSSTGDLTINGNATLGDTSGDAITINGTPTFSSAATFNGNTVLGDTSADTVSFTATPTLTVAADKKITIDASTADQTQTSGVIDLNIDAGVTNVAGEDIAISVLGDYHAYGQKITLTTSGADLGATTVHAGEAVYLAGKNSATSVGNYWGNGVFSQSSTNNDGNYVGYAVAFDDIMGGVDFTTGTADVIGMQAYIDRTSATAASNNLTGIELSVKNRGGAAASAAGVNVTLDVSAAVTASVGYAVSESGTGTVGDGLLVQGSVTDGVDVSATDIVNGISIGSNNILSGGTVTFSRAASGIVTLTAVDDNSDADLKLDPGGAGSLLLDIRQADLAVGSCTAGELAYDTAGTAELCFCKTMNNWSCINFTTATGPTD